jgi:serine/threonine protein phosphatase PrpC
MGEDLSAPMLPDESQEVLAHELETLNNPVVEFSVLDSWQEAKNGDPSKNEDVAAATATGLFLADGATDKTGFSYPSGKTGGRELAEIAVTIAQATESNGYELADEVTTAIQNFYAQANATALTDPSMRAATTLVVARLSGDKLIVTQIGDTNARITMKDGSVHVLTNDKLVDTENAHTRSEHITRELADFSTTQGREPTVDERKAIIASGREAIMDRLKTQYTLQNNAEDSTYGYGTLDGLAVPRQFADGKPTDFVRSFEYAASDVDMVELVSDGFYGEFADEPSADAYQNLYRQIHETDPDKYTKYLSTKPIDDATVVIARLNQIQ